MQDSDLYSVLLLKLKRVKVHHHNDFMGLMYVTSGRFPDLTVPS